LPRGWIVPPPKPPADRRTPTGLDLTAALHALIADAARRCPEFAHIDPTRLLVTVTAARNRSRFGLQARVTPMRFAGGASTRRYRGADYRVQRYLVNGVEVLYLVTFCVPRFLDQSSDEKLVTVFHELYHIGPRFDGDLRRHAGRCAYHTHSKKRYDARMAELVDRYLATHPDPAGLNWLGSRAGELAAHFNGVYGTVVPRPKMVPVV
jgi:predicted metallopeptidase